MKTLCLFTNEFPYGTWEPFLETEVKYYTHFDKVIIFALQLRKEHAKTIRSVPKNITVIPVYKVDKWQYLINSVTALTDKNLYHELGKLKKNRRLGIRQIIELFVYLSRSHYEARKIMSKVLSKDLVSDLRESVLYSYRFEYQPYVAWLVKKAVRSESKIIVRAHGFDLYEEVRASGYIPIREFLLENIDYCFPCSLYGKEYLIKKYPQYREKICERLLGTADYGVPPYKREKEIRLLSCSNVVQVKRLNRLVDALCEIKDKTIYWTHFGDGVLLDEIKKLAKELPNNVKADFRGNIKNIDLMKIYSTENFDLFVNVSESEGIPVSIMEAMSFGIPCIATNVGGTSEIITSGESGILLDIDFDVKELANWICKFADMNENEYQRYRNNARKEWRSKCSADRNYKAFCEEIIKL